MGYERKEYKGNAAPTTLSGLIDSDDLSITVADATNWPTGGANGKFVVCIDRGEPGEEKLLCSSRTGTTITVAARGHDNTTPASHAAGKAVEHVLDAESVDQANRYVNLQTTKGDILVHNGTTVVRLATAASDASDDGKVLTLRYAQPTGLVFDAFQTLVIDPNAPAVDGAVRLWYDETNDQLRPSDGASWFTPVQLPAFGSTAARDSYFAETAGCACWRTDLGFAEVYTGAEWRPLGRALFASVVARDAYYTGPFDGAQAYLTDSHSEQLYRAGEWVTVSHKVTVSATAPGSPLTGDLWLEPIV